ncbi:MAG: hypothetical protein IKZ44_01535 [Clostridia bacterium]|nr:hypothetical protein [Clostridia bacterium]
MAIQIKSVRSITKEFMHDYIENEMPKDKKWFYSVAFPDGKFNYQEARKAFINRYAPELAPKKKTDAKTLFAGWDK